MTKEQLDKTIEKIQEILGLETDPNGQPIVGGFKEE